MLSAISANMPSSRDGPAPSFILAMIAILFCWLGLIIFLGGQGVFHAAESSPPLATLTAFVGPPILFLLAQRNAYIGAQTLKIDPIWVVAVQGLRILGAGFLFVYAFGHLPGVFAFFAGWGDVLVAILAPFVVAKLAAQRSFITTKRYLGFHVLGLLDFVGALGSGLVARGTIPLRSTVESTEALGQFPLLLIPCFAVPMWICLHIIAIRQRNAALAEFA
ncbi:MAG: hypothetical protein WA790_09820 [Sulfitobacter sp.]